MQTSRRYPTASVPTSTTSSSASVFAPGASRREACAGSLRYSRRLEIASRHRAAETILEFQPQQWQRLSEGRAVAQARAHGDRAVGRGRRFARAPLAHLERRPGPSSARVDGRAAHRRHGRRGRGWRRARGPDDSGASVAPTSATASASAPSAPRDRSAATTLRDGLARHRRRRAFRRGLPEAGAGEMARSGGGSSRVHDRWRPGLGRRCSATSSGRRSPASAEASASPVPRAMLRTDRSGRDRHAANRSSSGAAASSRAASLDDRSRRCRR